MKQPIIDIKGARVNNLKNLDLQIPLNNFIVITGVSGSGKSSLAFDTLYAEGQRRYVESLSAYARQFLTRMPKPDCDYINGLPPSIAIEQKVNTRNPRSTVGTSTEIYDYLRMLFARIGHTYSPISGKEVKKHTIEDIIKNLMSYKTGTRFVILIKITVPEGRTFKEQFEIYRKEGFSRLEKNGEFIEIDEFIENDPLNLNNNYLLIDRMTVSDKQEDISRLTDSLETAFYEGNEECVVKVWTDDGVKTLPYSKRFEADGMEFREPNDLMFNFNNPYGACPECEGFGKVMGVSEDLVIPDKSLSIYQDAVQCWKGEKMSEWKRYFINLASKKRFPVHIPYSELTQEQKDYLWHGDKNWEGIDGFFQWVDSNQYKIQYRVLKARYRGKTICPKCKGSRLREDAAYVKVGNYTIQDLVKLPVSDLRNIFRNLAISETDRLIGKRLLTEITTRLDFLDEVGLGYLTLDRLSSTLSGGESQRINLATSLGSSLVGSLYILDEPSIGLHPRDTERLINVLKKLKDTGNTVVVVEHDEEIMNAADYLIDIGKDAGSLGGNIVYEGKLSDKEEASKYNPESYTLKYLVGDLMIDYSSLRRPWKKYIEIKGASENNLKNVNVKFPLGVLTVVTGVSGSGKSTLVKEILYKALGRYLGEPGLTPGKHKKLEGNLSEIKSIQFIDQNPIGASTRSNPATYLKAYDEIRKLFSEQQLSKQMGFTPSYFSFNSEGGRCEECKGEGKITVPMQFMADLQIKCEVCEGKRFKKEVLDVLYNGKNIYDILEMTVDDAITFFENSKGLTEKKIVKKLMPLHNVGLGYVKLGQSSSTLSGGENQRVKLAYFLSEENNGHNIFIFDEPTTGLHFHDISTLLKSINSLIEKGNTVIIIEHNLDMIKCADWIIDIGPEGGEKGGTIVAEGTPEEIIKNEYSYTAQYLAPKLVKFKSEDN